VRGFHYPRKIVIDYVGLQTDLELCYLFTLIPFKAPLVMVAGRFLRVITASFVWGHRYLWLQWILLLARVMLTEVHPPAATWYHYAFRIVLFLYYLRVAIRYLFIDLFLFFIALRTHLALIKYIIRK